jgi:hypothetical protein
MSDDDDDDSECSEYELVEDEDDGK